MFCSIAISGRGVSMNVRPEARSLPVRYGAPARWLHWLMAFLIAVQLPVGAIMSYRGNILDLWNATTDFLYSAHKLLGSVLLILVVVRFLVRMIVVSPPPEPGLARWQVLVASANHAGLYLLLLIVPVLGWLGASLFPALDVFGVISLPPISGADRAASDTVFLLHGLAALLLTGLIFLHVGAALFHRFVRRDGVLRRMWG
jgi:cytochrome b561